MDNIVSDQNESLEEALRRFVKFGEFKLVSGEPTKVYVDIKEAATNPKVLKAICNKIINKMIIDEIVVDYISGIELGGVLIAVLLSVETKLPLIIVRKKQKEHGITGRLIGNFDKGKTVLFIEDVTTTGGSAIEAISVLREKGLIVEKVITVVDREEGAETAYSKEGIQLIPLVKLGQLLKK